MTAARGSPWMNATLASLYRKLADRLEAIHAAGGPRTCNGAWERFAECSAETRRAEAELILNWTQGPEAQQDMKT